MALSSIMAAAYQQHGVKLALAGGVKQQPHA